MVTGLLCRLGLHQPVITNISSSWSDGIKCGVSPAKGFCARDGCNKEYKFGGWEKLTPYGKECAARKIESWPVTNKQAKEKKS